MTDMLYDEGKCPYEPQPAKLCNGLIELLTDGIMSKTGHLVVDM